MGKKALALILILTILFAFGCTRKEDKWKNSNENMDNGSVIEENGVIEDGEEVDEIQEIIDNMTLEEKIGQLFIFGIDGIEIDEQIIELIQKYKVGGFIFFGDNIDTIEQAIKLLNDIKKENGNNPLPLFLAIDEEGGQVTRLADIFPSLPDAGRIGNINEKEISYEFGKLIGQRLKTIGFNMDFAPVLDINSNPNNPVIGNRAFGSNKEVVIDNGIEVMKGINSENIISIVKHFPGHGDTTVDSHIDLPIIAKSLEELKGLELAPFERAIEEEVDGIMIAHILFHELDNKYPATLSQNIITHLLREDLAYDGVVISDDMTMGAIMENYTVEEAALRFFQAGGDIALICHGYENMTSAFNRVKEEVYGGNLQIEEINQKVYRIISLKRKYNLADVLVEEYNIEEVNEKIESFLNKIK